MQTPASSARLTIPVWTLLISGGVVIVYAVPGLREALIYDRESLAHGEWWRLVTGNLVHHSGRHLGYDLLAFLIAGALIEIRRLPGFAVLCLASGIAVGAVVYFLEPGMRYYGGLSGVVTAAVVYLCLWGVTETGWWRWLCAGVLSLMTVKIGVELALNQSLLDTGGQHPFVPVPLSHAAGVAGAVLLFVATRTLTRTLSRRRRANVIINGKPVAVEWTARAQRALESRPAPLMVELELYFSCLVKKFVHFREHPGSHTVAPVNDRLSLYFRPVMSTACSIETVERLGRQPETEITTASVRKIAPKRVWLDYQRGNWVGEFWL